MDLILPDLDRGYKRVPWRVGLRTYGEALLLGGCLYLILWTGLALGVLMESAR